MALESETASFKLYPMADIKTLTMQSALDSGSYREKLSVFMEQAKTMHLSEREAAQRYGTVVAALVVLQRRVRVWINERKQRKDEGKVAARTQWEFNVFTKPDRSAAV